MIMIIYHFYSATQSTATQRRGYCIGISRRSAQATVSEGLAQDLYIMVRAGIEISQLPFDNWTQRLKYLGRLTYHIPALHDKKQTAIL